jgi:hypothetical protein
MALTRGDSKSWIPDSTRGGSSPVSETWNSGPRIPFAPDGVREVGFTVQVEIRYKDSMLESEDAIQGALDEAVVTATAEAPESFERTSCRSRPEGVPGELRSLGVILAPCGKFEDWVPHPMDAAPVKKQSERANFRANRRPEPFARVGLIDRSLGEPPCARRCRRTDARKTTPRPSLMQLFNLLSQD